MLHTVISPLLRSCVIHSRLQTNLFECKIWPRKYICLQKSYEIHSRECQFPIRSSSPKRMYNIGNMRTKDYTLIVVNTSGVLRPSHHLWQIASLNNFAQCFLGNHQHPRTLAILETQKSDFPPSNPRHTWGHETLSPQWSPAAKFKMIKCTFGILNQDSWSDYTSAFPATEKPRRSPWGLITILPMFTSSIMTNIINMI